MPVSPPGRLKRARTLPHLHTPAPAPMRLRRTQSRHDLATPCPRGSRACGKAVANRWRLGKKLGRGAFSSVYMARDIDGDLVAVKVDYTPGRGLLHQEYAIYQWLHRMGHKGMGVGAFVPRAHYFGEFGRGWALVLDCMGKSLERVMRERERGRLGVRGAVRAGLDALRALEWLHSRSIVHRDVKPANMVVGENGRVGLVDLGLAGWFRRGPQGKHVEYKEGCGAVGTVDFASVYAMDGVEVSRRDDLISLAYSMVYLYRGHLPWSRVGGDMDRIADTVREFKIKLRARVLCKGMPREVARFVRYVRDLEFDARPDYGYLKGLLREALRRRGYDGHIDWTSSSGERS